MKLQPQSEVFTPTEDQRWLGTALGTSEGESVTFDDDAFLAIWPDGTVPSGVVLYKDGLLHKPYSGVISNEVQTLTEGGAGLTSFTLTFGGQTTASLDDDATPAQVQAALEALSTIGAGNVEVTGTTAPIAMTVRFVGDLADQNVAALTSTPTGGTGTVVVATTTAGGAESPAVVATGHSLTTKSGLRAGGRTSASQYWIGRVKRDFLPPNSGLDANAEADLNKIRYVDR